MLFSFNMLFEVWLITEIGNTLRMQRMTLWLADEFLFQYQEFIHKTQAQCKDFSWG